MSGSSMSALLLFFLPVVELSLRLCMCTCVRHGELFLAHPRARARSLHVGSSGTQAAMWPSEISARQRPLHSR